MQDGQELELAELKERLLSISIQPAVVILLLTGLRVKTLSLILSTAVRLLTVQIRRAILQNLMISRLSTRREQDIDLRAGP